MVKEELQKICDLHATCLEGIPKSIGTQKNESLHRKLNAIFRDKRSIGFELASAIVKVIIHVHNKRMGVLEPSQFTPLSYNLLHTSKRLSSEQSHG